MDVLRNFAPDVQDQRLRLSIDDERAGRGPGEGLPAVAVDAPS
jgi:hypothetical protein